MSAGEASARGCVIHGAGDLRVEDVAVPRPGPGEDLHAVRRAGEVAGRHVLVTGAGPIGALVVAAAKAAGAARVTVTDLLPAALEYARAAGADTLVRADDPGDSGWPMEVDTAIEASGAAAGLLPRRARWTRAWARSTEASAEPGSASSHSRAQGAQWGSLARTETRCPRRSQSSPVWTSRERTDCQRPWANAARAAMSSASSRASSRAWAARLRPRPRGGGGGDTAGNFLTRRGRSS